MTDETIAHYRIASKLGEGGMGVVYKALDTHLDRWVALKVLRPGSDTSAQRMERLIAEGRAASALNHPNIVVVHDSHTDQGRAFIAMELVEGQSLNEVIPPEGLDLPTAMRYATEIASALAAAHEAGIIHRDLKPANIMVRKASAASPATIKVLDFGLSKLSKAPNGATSNPESAATQTSPGVAVGTVVYMSPEQAHGKPVDIRSDIFSFGTTFYQMLTGKLPFQADSALSTLMAIVQQEPAPVRSIRPGIPASVERILKKCLAKEREHRYASGAALHADLLACLAELQGGPAPRASSARYLLAAAIAGVLLVTAGVLWVNRSGKTVAEALAELKQHIADRDFTGAYRLAEALERREAGNPQLAKLWPQISRRISLKTDPADAEVLVQDSTDVKAPWRSLGRTPLQQVRLPLEFARLRFMKPGYQDLDLISLQPGNFSYRLLPVGTNPGMVSIRAGNASTPQGFYLDDEVTLAQFLIDRYEVTNEDFKKFVDAGGYSAREHWTEAFQKDGQPITWDAAMATLVDQTGRPGPAGWNLSAYPAGQQRFPVGGVSWYEAQAYCRWVGKRLPTVHQWSTAGALGSQNFLFPRSNLSGTGPREVGAGDAVNSLGLFDTAGNVKEWVWNRNGNKRFLLGGAWNDPTYMASNADSQPPLDRSPDFGFRCAVYDPADLPPVALGELIPEVRDHRTEHPAPDNVLQAYRAMFSYDAAPLNTKTESVDDKSEYWTIEKVSYDAAYDQERIPAYLIKPKNVKPPYQTVLFFGGSGIENTSSSANGEALLWNQIGPLVRSGRAVLNPVYKGTYERQASDPGKRTYATANRRSGVNAVRDRVIAMAKDVSRSLDFLESREDLQKENRAYLGASLGARLGIVFLALDNRFRTAVLVNGGFHPAPKRFRAPEVDEINYAPRVRLPVLMINGRDDFTFPLEISQRPLFQLLGTPADQKRHSLYSRGHGGSERSNQELREILGWLDEHLGKTR